MNILNYDISSDCDERLQPIFLMKWIAQDKAKSEKDLAKKFIEDIMKHFKGSNISEFFTIINYIIENKKIVDKHEIIKFLDGVDMNTINEISNSGIFAHQCLAKFRKLEDKELKNLIEPLKIHIEKSMDYNSFVENTIKTYTDIDDNVIETIENVKYIFYKELRNNDVERIIYVYDNGLIILFDNLLDSTKTYKYKFCSEQTINNVKSFLEKGINCAIRSIIRAFERGDELSADDIMLQIPRPCLSTSEVEDGYLWAENRGVKEPFCKYLLAQFYDIRTEEEIKIRL
ncbi:MAG: hypothetical protein J6J36_07705 [Clostridia bacterium]|nr:hypothetical protein [Clostridia bacterium]